MTTRLFTTFSLFIILINFCKYNYPDNIFDNCSGKHIACAINAGNTGDDKQFAEPEIVLIKGGDFKLGSEDGEINEKPVHLVKLSDFYIGKYEVTNSQYCEFLNERGNKKEGGVEWIDLKGKWDDTTQRCRIYIVDNLFKVETGYENYPVAFVSWYGADAYCKWLSEKTKRKYRLPTEAEWEFVARAGGQAITFTWGNEPPVGKHPGNFGDEALRSIYPAMQVAIGYNDGFAFQSPVGLFEPNPLGIYDLAGNVWEWCSDWFEYSYADGDGVKNPQGPAAGTLKVTRGGSWLDRPANFRVSRRVGIEPTARSLNMGFRVAAGI